MINFSSNLQDLLSRIQERRKLSWGSTGSFQMYAPVQTSASGIKSRLDDFFAKLKNPTLETPKPTKLFTETPDIEPELKQPQAEKEPVFETEMYANYGIVCPKDVSLDEKWVTVSMNYGIVCSDDVKKPAEEEPHNEDIYLRLGAEMQANYGIVCPKDDTPVKETMMYANYGIVCPFDANLS